MEHIHYQAFYTMSAKGLSIGLLKIMKATRVLCKLHGKEEVWKVDPTKVPINSKKCIATNTHQFLWPFLHSIIHLDQNTL
jgi:hypothetical protein